MKSSLVEQALLVWGVVGVAFYGIFGIEITVLIGVSAAGVYCFFYLRQERRKELIEESKRELARELTTLEELYKDKKISREEFERKSEYLKRKL